MKDFLQRIRKALKLDGRDMAVFLLSLLLACSIWFLHNLSLKYTDFVDVPVRVSSNLEGRFDVSSNTEVITARCRTTGYNLVRARMFARKGERTVDVPAESLRHRSGDVYYLTSKELQEVSHLVFGETVSVEYFITDTVFFSFPRQECRKVPVVLYSDIGMAQQYMVVGDVVLEPDSVLVYGEPSVIENISGVSTSKLYKGEVKSSFSGVLKLRKPGPAVRLSEESVRYSAVVSRFVELTKDCPVEIVNCPFGKEFIVIPSTVSVSFRCGFPYSEDPTETVSFYVDCNDYISSRAGKCPVKFRNADSRILDCSISPAVVECVER